MGREKCVQRGKHKLSECRQAPQYLDTDESFQLVWPLSTLKVTFAFSRRAL